MFIILLHDSSYGEKKTLFFHTYLYLNIYVLIVIFSLGGYRLGFGVHGEKSTR